MQELNSIQSKKEELEKHIEEHQKKWEEEKALLETKYKEKQAEIAALRENWDQERNKLLQQVFTKPVKCIQSFVLQIAFLHNIFFDLIIFSLQIHGNSWQLTY